MACVVQSVLYEHLISILSVLHVTFLADLFLLLLHLEVARHLHSKDILYVLVHAKIKLLNFKLF